MTHTPTAEDVVKRQLAEHGVVPAKSTALATSDVSAVGQYLNEYSSLTGQIFKFAKDGRFRKTSDDEEIAEGTELVVVYDQIQVGWIRFNGKGVPPERRMGAVFSGYMPPPRDSLGDMDQSAWETDLSGKPADPWQHQNLVPMENPANGDLLIFATSSITGRREVGNLLRHCSRMARNEPDFYPVIKLQVSGFQHRDQRVGYVRTPKFAVVGKAPKSNAKAAATNIASDLSDEITF
jgi:hypothetical protein